MINNIEKENFKAMIERMKENESQRIKAETEYRNAAIKQQLQSLGFSEIEFDAYLFLPRKAKTDILKGNVTCVYFKSTPTVKYTFWQTGNSKAHLHASYTRTFCDKKATVHTEVIQSREKSLKNFSVKRFMMKTNILLSNQIQEVAKEMSQNDFYDFYISN